MVFHRLLNLISPMGDLPRPTGRFQNNIATQELLLHEERLLLCKVWYPSNIDFTNSTSTGNSGSSSSSNEEEEEETLFHRSEYVQSKYFPYLSSVLSMPLFLVRRYFSIGVHSWRRGSLDKINEMSTKDQSLKQNQEEAELALHSSIDKYPCVVFCAGLYGMPEHYTAICEELASQGYVVLAPYHTDGSCPAVLTEMGEIHWEQGKEHYVDVTRMEDKEHVKTGMEKYRASQIEIRSLDVLEVLKTLEEYCNHDGSVNSSSSNHPNGSSSDHNNGDVYHAKAFPGFDIFKNRIDMNRLACIGHSFGGGTAVSAITWMHEQTNEPYFKIGISLDGWMEPLKFGNDLSKLDLDTTTSAAHNNGSGSESTTEPFLHRLIKMNQALSTNDKSKPPVLAFINSEVWQWEENKRIMKQIADYWSKMSRVYLWSMPQSGHHNYNDIGLLMPKFGRLIKILKTNLDPVKHMADLNQNLVDLLELHLNSAQNSASLESKFDSFIYQSKPSSNE